jgi:hypothetical protein
MFVKEIKAEFHGHQIAVRNVWGFGLSLKAYYTEARLYINGKVVDTNSDSFLINSRAAILRGSIETKDRIHVVEIYARSLVRTRIKICVDGERIAGDLP